MKSLNGFPMFLATTCRAAGPGARRPPQIGDYDETSLSQVVQKCRAVHLKISPFNLMLFLFIAFEISIIADFAKYRIHHSFEFPTVEKANYRWANNLILSFGGFQKCQNVDSVTHWNNLIFASECLNAVPCLCNCRICKSESRLDVHLCSSPKLIYTLPELKRLSCKWRWRLSKLCHISQVSFCSWPTNTLSALSPFPRNGSGRMNKASHKASLFRHSKG